eukprot:GHVL01002745.1.p1 GENE.GHVL01002745.1~~GHVL01002745.1.p1  ORF type:complete len:178 (+),score=27.34 GHVL01002745.1:172-705(+)
MKKRTVEGSNAVYKIMEEEPWKSFKISKDNDFEEESIYQILKLLLKKLLDPNQDQERARLLKMKKRTVEGSNAVYKIMEEEPWKSFKQEIDFLWDLITERHSLETKMLLETMKLYYQQVKRLGMFYEMVEHIIIDGDKIPTDDVADPFTLDAHLLPEWNESLFLKRDPVLNVQTIID